MTDIYVVIYNTHCRRLIGTFNNSTNSAGTKHTALTGKGKCIELTTPTKNNNNKNTVSNDS